MSFEQCIKSLAKQQFDLRCESSMHAIQSFNHDEYVNDLKDDYSVFLLKLKNHFLHFIYVVHSDESTKNRQISFSTNLLKDDQDIKIADKIHIKSLIYFIEKLMENDGYKIKINLDNQDFISTLTFSLFPAISTYFHINLIPTLEQGREVFDYQIYNYNNVFLYLSEKIQKSQNEENKAIYQTIFDLLMRPMFASPLFINFCINFFQPLLSELQNKEIKEGFKDFSISTYLLSQFEVYFDLYLHLIPSYILINLKASDNSIRTLRKSFFEIALKSPESSQFYGLFHYSKPPNEFMLKSLRYLFLKSDEVINMFGIRLLSIGDIVFQQMSEWKEREKLGQINILTCSCSETILTNIVDDVTDFQSRVGLALRMKNYYFEENVLVDQNRKHFQKVLLSSADIELLKYIFKKGSSEKEVFKLQHSKSSKFYYINFNNENVNQNQNQNENENDNNDQQFLTKTLRDDPSEIAPNLRHLLQNSDPIPNFITPPSMDIETFFDEYLVSRGPLQLLPKRKTNKHNIFELLPKKEEFRIKRIMAALPETSLDQDKEIQKLTMASLFKKKVNRILFICYKINDVMKLIDNIILLKNANSDVWQNFKSKVNKEYIKNPKLFETDADFNKSNLDKKYFPESKIVLMKMIDKTETKSDKGFFSFAKTKIIYRPFFLDYQLSSSFNSKFDEKIHSLLAKSGKTIIDISTNISFPTKNIGSRSKFKKNKYITEKVQLIPKIRKEIIIICNDAFDEYSILRKLELFDKSYKELKAYIEEDLPDAIDAIGADEMTPLMILVIFMANPSNLVTNSEILKNFFSYFYGNDFISLVTIMSNLISSALLDLKRTLDGNELMQNQNELVNDLDRLLHES